MEQYKINEQYYQIPYEYFFKAYPLTEVIYKEFVNLCKTADIDFMSSYFNDNILSQDIYSTLKNDLFDIPDKHKYREIEKGTVYVSFDKLPHWYAVHAQFQHKIFKENQTYVFPEFHSDQTFLQNVAESNIKARGLFYYPKNSFREWHTNENDMPGMRFYFVYSDTYDSGMNFLIDNKVVTVYDKPKHVNCFCVSKHNPLWHNVFSYCNRFSLGLNI
jgi:phage pi2 protein 07